MLDVGSSYELHDGAELDADAARVIKKLEAKRGQLSNTCRTLEAQRSVGGQSTESRHAILTLTKEIDDIDKDIALLQQGADPGSIGNDAANASVPDAPLVAAAADDAHHHTPHRVRDIAAAAAENAAAKKPTGCGNGDNDGDDDDGGGDGCLGDTDDIASACLCGTCQWCLQLSNMSGNAPAPMTSTHRKTYTISRFILPSRKTLTARRTNGCAGVAKLIVNKSN